MGLRLIDYDPNDYKLSSVLSSGSGELITSIEQISAAFALYFKWSKDSPAWAKLTKSADKSLDCTFSKDDEERNLSQIFVEIPLASLKQEKFYENIFSRMIIFETCFEFESEIIDAWTEGDSQWLVIQVPTQMKAIRARKSPRAYPSTEKLKAKWNDCECTVDSVGLSSVVVNKATNINEKGTLTLCGINFTARSVRRTEDTSYLELEFISDTEAGYFFEFYASYRYPNLVNRSKCDLNEVLSLYERCGFFSNFSGSFEETDRHEKTLLTWKNIVSAQHTATADYCLNKDNRLIGASSLGLCIKEKNIDYWVFHQLCSDKELSSLDDTGELYTWRAEYLWSRKAELTTVFWFRSSSRWLERIYVKFLMQNPSVGELRNGNTYSYMHKSSTSSVYEVKLEDFGTDKRATYSDDFVSAAGGPDYVHAGRNMNIIISKDGSWEIVVKTANSICKALGKEQMYFRVDMPIGISPPPDESVELQLGSDRFARIDKSGLLDLVTCIKHSIAVTKSKKGVA